MLAKCTDLKILGIIIHFGGFPQKRKKNPIYPMFHWLLYHFDKLTFFSVDSGQFGLFKLHLKICHLHIEKYFQRLVTNYLIVYGLLGLADKILSPA